MIKGIINFVMDCLETITFAGSLYIVIVLFLFQPTQVQGASMEPTLHTGERIVMSKITYKLRPMERGDIVVVNSPRNRDVQYIKRLIGLPGDKIEVKNQLVYVNNQPLQENYISAPTNLWDGGFLKADQPVTVPAGYIFVMGDNRPRSSDSREFGFIPTQSVVGTAIYRYFPPGKIGLIGKLFD